jgi:hypothetical protein
VTPRILSVRDDIEGCKEKEHFTFNTKAKILPNKAAEIRKIDIAAV